MHCGRLCSGLETTSRIAQDLGTCHDGRGRMASSLLAHVVPAVSRGALSSLRQRATLRRIMCVSNHESSRRHSYKRRKQLPSKKFPEAESEVHKNQLERQKARAFDFSSCGEDGTSTSDANGDKFDEHWSSQIFMQVELIWLLLQYSSVRFEYWLASLLPLPRRKGRGRSRQQQKNYQDSQELVDLLRVDANSCRDPIFVAIEDASTSSYEARNARALTVAVDLRNRGLADAAAQWELNLTPQRRRLNREPKKLQLLFNQATSILGRLDFFQWLERLSQTYGTSFMVLVVLGYCTQGFRCFPWLAMAYFFKDNLQVDPGTMQLLMSTATLPMIAKPIYGVISDSVYIRGAHRIPYLIIAGAVQMVSWGAIVMHPGASSSIAVLTGVLTLSNMGAAISEVMNDALVAEAGKNKKGAQQGELQSLAWLALAAGGLLGNLMGGFALQRLDITTMFSIFMMLVGAQLLLCLTISEGSFGLGQPQESDNALLVSDIRSNEKAILLPQKTKRICSRFGCTPDDVANQDNLRDTLKERTLVHYTKLEAVGKNYEKLAAVPKSQPLGMREQLSLLSDVLRKPEVLRPLIWFLSSYAVIPGLGSSMFFYQTQHLGLDSSVVGLVKVVGQTGLLAGSLFYNRSLKKVSLRKLFGGVQTLLAFCMLSDIVLVNRVNLQLGIPDEYFVLGASAFVEALAQFKILPFMVLLAHLCPPGSEGSLFAFFMSAQCLAGTVSAYLGVGLASYLHISSNSFDELPLGIVIQASFALLPVLWINFIPEEPESSLTHQQRDEKASGDVF